VIPIKIARKWPTFRGPSLLHFRAKALKNKEEYFFKKTENQGTYFKDMAFWHLFLAASFLSKLPHFFDGIFKLQDPPAYD
jgi:hypothetical protein